MFKFWHRGKLIDWQSQEGLHNTSITIDEDLITRNMPIKKLSKKQVIKQNNKEIIEAADEILRVIAKEMEYVDDDSLLIKYNVSTDLLNYIQFQTTIIKVNAEANLNCGKF